MDWGRAKTILIFSFLLLNLMLGYELWGTKWNVAEKDNSEEVLAEISTLAADKGIVIDTDIPKDVPKLKEIVANPNEELNGERIVALQAPVKRQKQETRMWLRELQGQIGYLDHYAADPAISGSDVMVFNQMYGNFPIFEVNLELFVQNEEIVSYRQTMIDIELSGIAREQKVIPASTAVRSLMENYLSEGSVIQHIELGYRGRYQLLLPTWRIVTARGTIYYVNAFNGAIEVPQPTDKQGENREKQAEAAKAVVAPR